MDAGRSTSSSPRSPRSPLSPRPDRRRSSSSSDRRRSSSSSTAAASTTPSSSGAVGLAVGSGVVSGVGSGVVSGVGSVVVSEVHAAPFPRSQQPDVPHGATRLLPELAEQYWTLQSSGGNVPAIWLFSRRLRRRGAVERRAGRRGRGGNSQLLQLRELADLGRDRAFDLVVLEVPATPSVGRASRRVSGTRGELAGAPAPRDCRSRSGSGRRSCSHGAPCDAKGRSRAAPAVGDAGGTRRYFSAVSWPISGGIGPEIWLLPRTLRRRGAVARRAGRR